MVVQKVNGIKKGFCPWQFVITVLCVCMVVCGLVNVAWGVDGVNVPASVYSADQLVRTGRANLYGILVATDGTNAVTIDVYDSLSGSGTKVIPTIVIPTSATMRGTAINFENPVQIRTGIYVDVTTSGTVGYTVYYNTKYK